MVLHQVDTFFSDEMRGDKRTQRREKKKHAQLLSLLGRWRVERNSGV
jgi:hypothetical protein